MSKSLKHFFIKNLAQNYRKKLYLPTIWILFILTTIIKIISGEIIFRVDPLALLSVTLKTYQRAVCDTDNVVLTCPRGTSISIEIAQYSKQDDGTTIDELCPLEGEKKQILIAASLIIDLKLQNNSVTANNTSLNLITTEKITNHNRTFGGNESYLTEITTSENCMWPNAFQYSLLQSVVDACQKKKYCKFNATPDRYGLGESGVGDSTGTSSFNHKIFMVDPCPRTRRFVEIAYKCRPYEFRTKMACGNEIVQLECNPYSRIAIYSASFGRTEYESIQCPQPSGVREETCLSQYSTETVMKICHARRRCTLTADSKTFGSPCQQNSRMYLKVVYTCVPKQVLKDPFESSAESDEPDNAEGDINEIYDDDPFYKESEAIPKLQNNLTGNISNNNHIINNSSSTMNSLVNDVSNSSPIMTHSQELETEDDDELFYVLTFLAATTLIIFSVILLLCQVSIRRKQQRSSDSPEASTKAETHISANYNDELLESDGDIDLAAMQIPSVSKNENFITYSSAGTIFRNAISSSNNLSDGASAIYFQPSGIIKRQSPDVIGVGTVYSDGDYGNPNNQNLVTHRENFLPTLQSMKITNCGHNINHNEFLQFSSTPPPPQQQSSIHLVSPSGTINQSTGLFYGNQSTLQSPSTQNIVTMSPIQTNTVVVMPETIVTHSSLNNEFPSTGGYPQQQQFTG